MPITIPFAPIESAIKYEAYTPWQSIFRAVLIISSVPVNVLWLLLMGLYFAIKAIVIFLFQITGKVIWRIIDKWIIDPGQALLIKVAVITGIGIGFWLVFSILRIPQAILDSLF